MSTIFSTAFLLIGILLVGCASGYKSLEPSRLRYPAPAEIDQVQMSYFYNILQFSGNKKYANKEWKKNIRLVAVKLTNNSDSTLTVGKEISFYENGSKINLLNPHIVTSIIKQKPAGYFPYMLLTFLTLTVREYEDGQVVSQKVYRPGLFLGPGVTLGNMITANAANDKLKSELTRNNLIGREIKKGETIHGIICFASFSYNPITIQTNK